MVNSFLDAVTTQLGKTFGTGYHYYVENVKQNLTLPAFTIDVLMPLERSRSPRLYDRTMPLVIHYFSDNKQNLKRDSVLQVIGINNQPFPSTRREQQALRKCKPGSSWSEAQKKEGKE